MHILKFSSTVILLAFFSFAAEGQTGQSLVAVNLDNFNSKAQEMCPLVSWDNTTFYFTREVRSERLSENDLFQSSRMPDGSWGKPEQMKMFKQASTVGAVSMDSVGDVYISYLPWSNSKNDLDIGKVDGDKIVRLDDINGKSWDAQPSISADGNELYFVSNRDGEETDVRIFVSKRKPGGGTWMKPVPLDVAINTGKFTGFPSISPDGLVLFFSSNRNGHAMEIWAVTRKNKDENWSTPFVLPAPANAEGNNVFAHLAPNGHEFYFASDRMGSKGIFDLYEIKLPNGIQDLIGKR